jgi:MFS family permease
MSGAILALGVLLGGLAGLPLGYVVMKTGRGKLILQSTGALMVGTYVGMTLTGSVPLLLILSFVNGIAWGFWPVLYTVAFHLPGIRPRQVAIALAFTLTMTSMGMVLGPLVSGFLQEALGSLKLTLLIVSLAPISLMMAGFALRVEPGGPRPAGRSGPSPS